MLAALNDFFESPLFHKGTFVDTRKEKENVVEKVEVIPPNKKWTRYVPENKYESLPIDTNEPAFLDDVRVRLEDLTSLDPAAHRKMLNALHQRRFFILSIEDNSLENKIRLMYKLMADFFACNVEFKKTHGKELLFGTSNFVGYHNIEFDNDDNKRDPESRDIFSLRLPYLDEMHWPENPEFKSTSIHLFQQFYQTAVFLLKSLGTQLAEDETVFHNLLTKNGSTQDNNPTSNFSLFRYYDQDMSYTTTQRCMIHQDSGLLTLVPKSTFPGLELLNLETKVWIPIEKYMKSNECVVYCGETMQRMTRGYIPAAVHRVVREPQQMRYSMPLEIKANEFCELRPIKSELVANEPIENLFDDMAFHHAKCDWCHDNIFGVRYKCKKCPDYDLCSKCIDMKKTVHSEHSNHFDMITKPTYDPLCNFLEIEDMTALEFTSRINNRRSLRKIWRRMEMFDH